VGVSRVSVGGRRHGSQGTAFAWGGGGDRSACGMFQTWCARVWLLFAWSADADVDVPVNDCVFVARVAVNVVCSVLGVPGCGCRLREVRMRMWTCL
jgi:hypothetical protein